MLYAHVITSGDMMAESLTPERTRVAESALVEVALDELTPHPRNYRSHPPAQIAHVAASIAANGVYRNVVAAQDLTLLAGHGVVEAARSLGLATIPVRILPIDPFSAPALAVLAGDNETARLAEDDEAALADLLRTIADEDAALLLGTGYDLDALDALTATLASIEVSAPEAFASYDETLATDYCCPSCGYEWSGKTA